MSTNELQVPGGVRNLVYLFIEYFKQNNSLEVITPRQLGFNPIKSNRILNVPIHSTFSAYPFVVENYYAWPLFARKYLSDFDIYQGIGGTFIGAEPFLRCNKHYFLWLGTTFLDEWNSVLKKENASNLKMASKFHRMWQNRLKGRIQEIERKIYNRADKIFSQSQYTTKCLIEKYDVARNHIDLIHCPIKVAALDSIKNTQFKKGKESYIITVSRLDTRKNLPSLINIFKEVKKDPEFRDLRLYIVGNGAQESELRTLIQKLHLQEDILIYTKLLDKQVYTLVNNALVYVSTSLQEGFGISILEAMYLSKPILLFDNGGSREYIKNNENGLIIPPGNDAEFTEKLKSLLLDEELRLKMGQKGHITANEFTPRKIFQKMEHYYRKV